MNPTRGLAHVAVTATHPAVDPTVSVLLPFRDAAPTLAEALDSLLAQEGPRFEVLAVDDGSADGGSAIVESRAARDPRVVGLRTEEGRRGIVAALVLAASRARGVLLGRMDADDVCLPGRLARQVELLGEDARLGAVGTRVEAFGSGEGEVGEGLRRYVEWQNGLVTPEEHARDIFVESPLCHPSTLIRREAFEAVGGYRDTGWWEDYDLWLRLWSAGWRLAKVPEVLLRWRHSTGRMTRVHPRAAPERIRELKAAFLAPWLAGRGLPVTIWGAGPTGRRLARALEPHGVHAARFVDIDPLKVGREARGAPIASPESLEPGRELIVVAVGTRGARALIRTHLLRAGFEESSDFVCAA